MKKIVLALASLLCFSAVSHAQSMKVYQDGELKAVYHVSKNDKIEFSDDFPFPGDDKPTENVHDYVDLGLPSGLKWATCNVGATKPEEYGDYFAWGETTGKQSGKTTFDWSTYKWCNGSQTTMTKYCSSSSYGKVDNKTVLDAEDDAATANWGKGWRMPTLAEFKELRNSCTWTWTTLNGFKGYKVVGTNGNFIFLPAAGSYEDKGASRIGAAGTYWTSSLGTVGSSHAFDIDFDYGGCYIDDNDYRFFYQSVRPVCQ